MERESLSSNVNRPSGLPRPASRLPVLRNRSSQVLLQKQQDAVEPWKPNTTTPKVQKRVSVATLTRPTQNAHKDSALPSKPFGSTGSVPSGPKHMPKGSTSSRGPIARPSSSGTARNPANPPAKPFSILEDREKQDQLTSLESFRSASRPSSRDESPTEPQEYAEPNEVSSRPERSKTSRPSLSDRTIESLQTLPSTPKDRRRSSFFSPIESPMGPPPRPSSSLSRNGQNGNSRPGTSDGSFARHVVRPPSRANETPASAKSTPRMSLGGFGFTPSRSVSSTCKGGGQENAASIPPLPKSSSPSKAAIPATLPNGLRPLKTGPKSKTLSSRQPKPRPALADTLGHAKQTGEIADHPDEKLETHSQTNTPKTSKRAVSNPSNAGSAALRQQIAAAKAAARKEQAKRDSPQELLSTAGHNTELEIHNDLFNQAPRDRKHILRNRINTARIDGKLNIAAMGLKHIPEEVMRMYDAAAMEDSRVSWAEVVDLARLNAADNEIEEIDDAVFPDISAEDLIEDDQTEGNQFGGLETLDLHGNRLQALPIGLRRLERLTMLNLAHNKLENTALEIVSQIQTLKDLRLGHNAISGTLPTALCNLRHLETLDLQSNRLLSLPEALRELVSLRVLNISGNQLTSLPMEALQEVQLHEIDANSNALIGSLFPLEGIGSHPTLRTLRLANNSLAALTFAESLNLPQLRTLDVPNNHLTVLPDVSSWVELNTLIAADNKISELPAGFITLRQLRNVNFTSNELRLLDPAIANMEALESLLLTANPLREKKFLTMTAADIKQDLRSRLELQASEGGTCTGQESSQEGQESLTSQSVLQPTQSWALKATGALDLSGRGLSDGVNDSLGSFLQRNEVKQLLFASNKLTAIPPALWLAQDLKILDLSGNSLGAMYLSDELELPSLQELNISRCSTTTLEPLVTQLHAPNLRTLNISLNRLTGPVPALRTIYPALTALLAGDNKFTSINADSLRGLHTVNLASNNIEQLPAEVGLLWEEGLRILDVGSNAFRVPNYRVLEKGTEATLRWLRDRLPAAPSRPAVNGGLDARTAELA